VIEENSIFEARFLAQSINQSCNIHLCYVNF